MLFCRTIPTQTLRLNTASKFVGLPITQTLISSRTQYQPRLNQKTDETINPTNKPLLHNSDHTNNNHYHYQ